MKNKFIILFLILLTSMVLANPCDDLNTSSPVSDLGSCGISMSQTTGITAESYLIFLYIFGLLACLLFDFNASVWYIVYATIAYIGVLVAPGDFAMSLFGSLLLVAGFFIFRFLTKMFK